MDKITNEQFIETFCTPEMILKIINSSFFKGESGLKIEELEEINLENVQYILKELPNDSIQKFNVLAKRYHNNVYLFIIAKKIDDLNHPLINIYGKYCYYFTLDKLIHQDGNLDKEQLTPKIYTTCLIYGENENQNTKLN